MIDDHEIRKMLPVFFELAHVREAQKALRGDDRARVFVTAMRRSYLDALQVTNAVVHYLFKQRPDIVADYVSTDGRTDWVWLEENLSGDLDREGLADTWYEVCFAEAVAQIFSRHPNVKPPIWLTRWQRGEYQ